MRCMQGAMREETNGIKITLEGKKVRRRLPRGDSTFSQLKRKEIRFGEAGSASFKA